MGISITLRTNRDISYFRRNLLSLIGLPGDTLLLCSGYISEGVRYSTIRDNLLDAILRSGCKVISVAGMFSGFGRNNRKKYITFISQLVANKVDVKAYETKNKKWHAKVAMKLNNDTPIAAIIGSSNLTRPAYAEGRHGYGFNHEADVILWSSKRYKNAFRKDFPEEKNKALGPIMAEISKEYPDQPSELERMNALYKLIMNPDFLRPVDIDRFIND